MTAQLPIAPSLAAIPPPSLASLPLEIKAEIVGQARGQDERYYQRIDADLEGHFGTSDLASAEWYGKSTTALSMVNKEFRVLAEAHLFRTIRCRKVFDRDARLKILPLFARNARVVCFETDAERYSVESVLVLLTSLPRIEALHVSGYAFRHLLGPGDPSVHQKDFVHSALRAVAPRISYLSLCFDNYFRSWFTATEIITSLSQVRELAISGDGPSGDRLLLRDTLAGLGHLEKLSLQGGLRYKKPLIVCDDGWSDVEWKSLETLKTHRLVVRKLNNAELRLVQLFSSSLEELHIESYRLSSTLSLKVSFPRLTNLTLQGNHLVITALLPLFATSPLAHLQLCRDRGADYNDDDYDACVLHLVHQRKSTLRSLTLATCRQSDSGVKFPVRDYCSAPISKCCADLGILLRRASDGYPDIFDEFYDCFKLELKENQLDPAEELQRTCDAAEELLRFGKDLMARMLDTGDLKGAKQSLGLLRDLRERQQLGWL